MKHYVLSTLDNELATLTVFPENGEMYAFELFKSFETILRGTTRMRAYLLGADSIDDLLVTHGNLFLPRKGYSVQEALQGVIDDHS